VGGVGGVGGQWEGWEVWEGSGGGGGGGRGGGGVGGVGGGGGGGGGGSSDPDTTQDRNGSTGKASTLAWGTASSSTGHRNHTEAERKGSWTDDQGISDRGTTSGSSS